MVPMTMKSQFPIPLIALYTPPVDVAQIVEEIFVDPPLHLGNTSDIFASRDSKSAQHSLRCIQVPQTAQTRPQARTQKVLPQGQIHLTHLWQIKR